MIQSVKLSLTNILKPGMRLSVKFEWGLEDNLSGHAILIGLKADNYVIVELSAHLQQQLTMRNMTNVTTIIHGLSDRKLGDVVAFKTSVLTLLNQPTDLLFLRYPKHYVSKPLRSHERITMYLDAEIKVDTVSYAATMVDFSASGCALFVKGENRLKNNSRVDVSCALSTLIPDNLVYRIVAIEKRPTGHKIGVKFDRTLAIEGKLKAQLLMLHFVSDGL